MLGWATFGWNDQIPGFLISSLIEPDRGGTLLAISEERNRGRASHRKRSYLTDQISFVLNLLTVYGENYVPALNTGAGGRAVLASDIFDYSSLIFRETVLVCYLRRDIL